MRFGGNKFDLILHRTWFWNGLLSFVI